MGMIQAPTPSGENAQMITLGNTENGSLGLDPMRLVDTRMLVQANSGGGKSWLLRLIWELACQQQP